MSNSHFYYTCSVVFIRYWTGYSLKKNLTCVRKNRTCNIIFLKYGKDTISVIMQKYLSSWCPATSVCFLDQVMKKFPVYANFWNTIFQSPFWTLNTFLDNINAISVAHRFVQKGIKYNNHGIIDILLLSRHFYQEKNRPIRTAQISW